MCGNGLFNLKCGAVFPEFERALLPVGRYEITSRHRATLAICSVRRDRESKISKSTQKLAAVGSAGHDGKSETFRATISDYWLVHVALANPREPPAGKGTFTVADVDAKVPVKVNGID